MKTPRIAVLGTDCAVGKRTTCVMLIDGCQIAGIRAEMVYTGQTGWLQGFRHGFILDATPNDFVAGELERALLECELYENPDVIFIEGQSSLRNPSGPCGAELLVSGDARGVILQHAPGRSRFEDLEELGCTIPPLAEEVQLIRLLGAEVLAVTLNEAGLDEIRAEAARKAISSELDVPVLRPMSEGVSHAVSIVKEFLA